MRRYEGWVSEERLAELPCLADVGIADLIRGFAC